MFGRMFAVMLAVVSVAAAANAVPVGAQETPGLGEARARVQTLTSEINEAEISLADLEADLGSAASENTLLLTEAEALRGRVVAAAISDFTRPNMPLNVLGSDGLTEALRGDVFSDIALGADLDAIEEYRQLFEDLAIVDDRLSEVKASVDAELERLRTAREALGVELARLEEVEKGRLAELARLAAEEAKRQAEEIRQRNEEAASAGGGSAPSPVAAAPSSGGGQLVYCPVQGSVSFIDSWGAARSGGRRHKGVDMMASTGTPIAAPVSGTVSHRSNRVGGRSFHLDGDDGNYYYGTHMSDYGASGRVDAGTIIGYVGDDGNARGIPHLHFEIHPGGGSAVNPFPAVNAAC